MNKKLTKILIANRGEIACRIIRTLRQLGITSVAVYSSADQTSQHVQYADEAYCIGPAPAAASYLNSAAILEVAIAHGVDAIHPGYGFLSENVKFAEACANAGIVFIGPSVNAMQAMASKQVAKQLLSKTPVPLTPGYHGNDQSESKLLAEAKRIGFPVLLKAAAGGGGKGMRAVANVDDFAAALAGARREAQASFADDVMIIEKLLVNPRHIEMQIMADNHGNVVHLYERDCSIQRRHQKIIEEAPAPCLSPTLRIQLAQAAIEVAHAIDYRGAGTIEFLVADEHFYFMEMNTRLQVEHPVTEMITDLDLVEWQIRIAANEPLPLAQSAITAHGHAIECRIYAEDPAHEFLPSIGQITFLHEPQGDKHVRLDSGIAQGSHVSQYYDPMLAKLIAWGTTRQEAQQRLLAALQNYHVGGVKTNLGFLKAIVSHPKFNQAELSTAFLTQANVVIPTPDITQIICFAACMDYLNLIPSDPLAQATFGWQMHLTSQWQVTYQVEHTLHNVIIKPESLHTFALKFPEQEQWLRLTSHLEGYTLSYMDDDERYHIVVECKGMNNWIFYGQNGPSEVQRITRNTNSTNSGTNASLNAPMPATVVAICTKVGDTIKAGERLIVLEAMKMEHTIHAPHDGHVAEIFYDVGAQVHEGAQLLALEKTP